MGATADEFLYVLSGEVTVVDDGGEQVLRSGDSACWPAGQANAPQVINRSEAPCSFLVCGTRVERDVVHYPELGQTLHIDGKTWRIVRPDGTLVKEGVEP